MGESEDVTDSKILEFKPRPENKPWDPKTENLVQKKPTWELDEHKHGPFLVDSRERTVACKRCGKLVDPIYCILIIAEFWHEMDYKISMYQDLKKRQDEKSAREKARRLEREKNKGGTML